MHFGLTDEQELLQESIRKLLEAELPVARLREIFDSVNGFDAALWRAAAEVGVQGLIVPEAFGGAGLSLLDLALAFEILGERAAPGPFLGHALTELALIEWGSRAQQEEWLPRLAMGECIAGSAIDSAQDPFAEEDEALRVVDGRVSGTKRFADVLAPSDAAPANASLQPVTDLFVLALADGAYGLIGGDAPGLRIERVDPLDRGRPLAHLHFDATPVELLAASAAANGPESSSPPGPVPPSRLEQAAAILLAADSFGAAWRMIRMTTEYAQTREQFGTRIAQFQAVKHQLADMAAEAEPMRGLYWYAAYAFDHRPEQCARDAALAKAHLTDETVAIGRGAVSIHGGVGFTWECDLQFWVKRSMMNRVWLGSPEQHRRSAAVLGGY